METSVYHVDLIEDEGTWRVECPDLPGVNTFGDDKDDALVNAADAIEEMLAALIAMRADIPAPHYRGGHPVHLPTRTALKASLYRAMREKGWRKANLARAMAVQAPIVDRLFDLNHETRLEQIDAAFAVLGKRIETGVSDLEAA